MARTAHIVLMSTMAFALSACDSIYFRRIDISGADTAAVDVRSPNVRGVISTLRDYAFESTKFERRMDHLQSMLAERFGAQSVQSSRDRCPLPPKS